MRATPRPGDKRSGRVPPPGAQHMTHFSVGLGGYVRIFRANEQQLCTREGTAATGVFRRRNSPVISMASSREFVEQRLRFLQVGSVEASSEPIVDRRKKIGCPSTFRRQLRIITVVERSVVSFAG